MSFATEKLGTKTLLGGKAIVSASGNSSDYATSAAVLIVASTSAVGETTHLGDNQITTYKA